MHHPFVDQNLTLELLLSKDHPCFRKVGNAHLLKLVEEARKSRTAATQQAVAVDGDAGGAAGGGGDPPVAKDPKKFCWNCKSPDYAEVNLRVCRGCNRVRYSLLDIMFASHPRTLACLLKSCTFKPSPVDKKAA